MVIFENFFKTICHILFSLWALCCVLLVNSCALSPEMRKQEATGQSNLGKKRLERVALAFCIQIVWSPNTEKRTLPESGKWDVNISPCSSETVCYGSDCCSSLLLFLYLTASSVTSHGSHWREWQYPKVCLPRGGVAAIRINLKCHVFWGLTVLETVSWWRFHGVFDEASTLLGSLKSDVLKRVLKKSISECLSEINTGWLCNGDSVPI